MMKQQAYIIFILIAAALFNTGCKKYLDVKPVASIVSPKTLEDAQALLDNSSVMNQVVTNNMGEISADDYFLMPNTYNALGVDGQKFYTWRPADYFYPNDWSKSYNAIYNANLALETIGKISISSQNQGAWNNIFGSALFYRSYFFTQLAWSFAKAFDESSASTDLGIVLRLSSDITSLSRRSTVRETYDQIIKDASQSITYLPTFSQDTFRPSKLAAYGLLARIYLSMRKYDSAFKYSDLYLQSRSALIDCKVNNTTDFATPTSSVPFKKFNVETIFYTEMNQNFPGTIISTSTAKIDSSLYFSFATNDLRRSAFFAANSGYQKFKGSYAGSTTILFTGIATDEMYLIKAECLARGVNGNPGDKNAAITVLNALLSKRYNNTFTGLTATDANDALNKILQERRKELIMRGLRWIDIKRLNKEGRNITPTRLLPGGEVVTLQPNSNYYALPLPKDIILQAGIEQNPQ